MCFVFIWEQIATCATYSINWLVFITEMKSVYSAVRTGSLNKAVCASSLKGPNSSLAIYLIIWLHAAPPTENADKYRIATGFVVRDWYHLHYIQSTLEMAWSDCKQLQHRYVIIWVSYIINLVGELIKFCWLYTLVSALHRRSPLRRDERVGDATIEFN